LRPREATDISVLNEVALPSAAGTDASRVLFSSRVDHNNDTAGVTAPWRFRTLKYIGWGDVLARFAD